MRKGFNRGNLQGIARSSAQWKGHNVLRRGGKAHLEHVCVCMCVCVYLCVCSIIE